MIKNLVTDVIRSLISMQVVRRYGNLIPRAFPYEIRRSTTPNFKEKSPGNDVGDVVTLLISRKINKLGKVIESFHNCIICMFM